MLCCCRVLEMAYEVSWKRKAPIFGSTVENFHIKDCGCDLLHLPWIDYFIPSSNADNNSFA